MKNGSCPKCENQDIKIFEKQTLPVADMVMY